MPNKPKLIIDQLLDVPVTLGGQLAITSEEERDEWADGVMYEAGHDRIALALDIMGWKIVEKEPLPNYDGRWSFDSEETGWPCPDWCSDLGPSPKPDTNWSPVGGC